MNQPAGENGRHFYHISLASIIQLKQKFRNLAIAFISTDPLESNAIGNGMFPQLKSNLPLWTIGHLFGYSCGFATVCVLRPTLWQEQLAIQKTVEIPSGVIQMYCNNTIVFLTAIAAPLTLNARGLVAFLGMACFIEYSNGTRMLMLASDYLLEDVSHTHFVPFVQRKKLLKVSRRQRNRVRHRLVELTEWRLQAAVLAGRLQTRRGVHPPAPVPAHEVRPGEEFTGIRGEKLSAFCLRGALLAAGQQFEAFGYLFVIANLPLALVEGLVTGSVVVLLRKVRPELLQAPLLTPAVRSFS